MKNLNRILFLLFAIYFCISIYFTKKFYIGTKVNGVDISCKTINDANSKIENKISDYILRIEERNGLVENIYGKRINLKYSSNNEINTIKEKQNPFLWPIMFFKEQNYNIKDIFSYDKELLKNEFNNLNCISGDNIIKPQNAEFQYTPDGYIIIEEIKGNTINREYLYAYIINSINIGINNINLENINCYENPLFTSSSEKVINNKDILNKYIDTTIYYTFDNDVEILDREIFNQWISVNDSMEIVFDYDKIKDYLKELCKKYDTFNKNRDFLTTSGKIITVVGGNYGWRIDRTKELELIVEDIKSGETIIREPSYLQRALGNREDDIGETYLEINLTRQYLWFYKDNEIVVQGDIVSGNISRGFTTPEGTYILNYKQKDATLKGAGYSSSVKYWMPFNGNIGLHDANWRTSFGGDIYKTNGSHGCVNTSTYVAKKVYENIEAGTPIICYYED